MTDKDTYLGWVNYLFCLLLGILIGLSIAVAIVIIFGPCSDGRYLMLD